MIWPLKNKTLRLLFPCTCLVGRLQHTPVQRPSSLLARTHKDDPVFQCLRQIDTGANSHANTGKIGSQKNISKHAVSRLVYDPPSQAWHQRMLPPGWGGGGAGKGPASSGPPEGEQYRWPHKALGPGDPSTPSLPALSGPESSRGTRHSAQEADASRCAAAPRVGTPPASRPLSHP